MKTSGILLYEMLARVKDYGASRTTEFPASGRIWQILAAIAAIVAEFSNQAMIQTASAGEAFVTSATKARLRVSIRGDLLLYSRTARLITADNPDLRKRFRIPKGGDQRLLSAARAFLHNIAPIEAEFPRNEVSVEALAKFRSDIALFEAAMVGRNKSIQSRIQATALMDDLAARGLKLVQELDVLLRVKYRDDKPNLLAWERASHVERPSVRSKEPGETDQKAADPVKTKSSGAQAGD